MILHQLEIFLKNFIQQNIKKFMPNTIFTQNINEIKKFIKINKKVILKPVHSFGGNDIHLLHQFNSKFIKVLLKNMILLCVKNIYLR